MILFTRTEARDFRALFSRCVSGRPRGPAPPVAIRTHDDTRTVTATTPGGVILSHTSPAPEERDDFLLLPASVLTEVEGGTDEVVTLERQSQLRAVVRWQGGGKPRTLPVELALPGKQHEIPTPPELFPVSKTVLAALHECGRSAARDNGRYALSRVQLRGKAGHVVGTDGKVALLWRGFSLPFTDDVLVPALTVFGSKPLVRVEDMQVGRTSTHIAVRAGSWMVSLPVETKARYPDVLSVIPRQSPTTATLDPRDVVELLKVLPTLPGTDDDNRPVTLDVNGTVTVRAADPLKGGVREVALMRSAVSGPSMRVALDRRPLARALSLGCHTLKLTPGKPFIAEGEGLTLVIAPLDPASVVPPPADKSATPADDSRTTPSPTNIERSSPMKATESNGHTPPRGDPPDPLFAAEELRDALADAATKAARLVTALKAGRKEKKVLATVFAGLKQLNLNISNEQP